MTNTCMKIFKHSKKRNKGSPKWSILNTLTHCQKTAHSRILKSTPQGMRRLLHFMVQRLEMQLRKCSKRHQITVFLRAISISELIVHMGPSGTKSNSNRKDSSYDLCNRILSSEVARALTGYNN